MLHKRLAATSAAICLGLAFVVAAKAETDTVIVAGTAPAQDPCLIVAGAKEAQWAQTPLMIHETKVYADDTTKVSETIFTINQAYAHYIGKPWNTAQFLTRQRSVRSAEVAAKAMRLTNCRLVGTVKTGEAAHLYAFDYLADEDGTRSTGRMTIADATGLPLEQDIDVNAAHPDSRLPVRIAATFAYGDAVKVPLDAQLAEYVRRSSAQHWLRNIQNGHAGM